MSTTDSTDDRLATLVTQLRRAFDPRELLRRNLVSVGMDALFLVTIGFFAILAGHGTWPMAIAAIPIATMLYFGWLSSPAFFIAELLAMVVAAALSLYGILPF